ncbi:magnesium-translocating P-type ATPase [Paludibaculum fermentans]|uniref:Magnesium-transporting ATPase, P-type 1 n=1 Tax=Paludibaculum fermentans TaxID=1473598 RepID=A0A7S7SM05_PALFE|nr:magnesium-translocating P-type ATPase [Paludibaculum fermentans]QOY89393.1 magnesium-translocating P-type ATPase [Paludibaculum fermentans]
MLKPLVELELKKINGLKVKPAGRALKNDKRVLEHASQTDALTLMNEFGAGLQGLSLETAEQRLGEYGPNTVVREESNGWWRHLLHAFNNAFILLLLALAGIAAISGDSEAATIISTMVLVSAILRFAQEFRSSKAAEKLNEMVQTTATVTRDGGKAEIAVDELVPGDIVHLSAGDMIPADLRLLAAKDLFVSQAALTGESMPVEKSAQEDSADTLELTERPMLCFMGTNVISGTGTGLVLQTGAATHLGELAREVTGRRVETEFDRGVSRVSRLLIRFTLVMVPLVFVLNGWTKGDWGQAFFFALSVAVGLTPEMLPMVVTANLARGAVNMSRKKVIVKRLHSIQNFGAMDVLCSDKTGTLTQDRVVLERHLDVLGRASEKVLQLAYLNSYYQTGLKNLLDVAVLQHAELEQGLHVATDYRLVDEIPFDFGRRRMSVAVETEKAEELLITKGAVEEMLRITTLVDVDRQLVPLKDELRAGALRMARELNEEGFRVIAVGYRKFPLGKAVYSVADETELILAGFVAFLDPPKESAAPAIQALKAHGVSVKILTGDNDTVTRRICTEVGIEAGRILLGREIARMSTEELQQAVDTTAVFAKVSPMEKARVIAALKARGHVVGFLGDGINDAAALREADIGISVNTAVDIAKESADIILLEKSLMVLEEGVLEGRRTFGNIVKYIRMGTSSNFGNMLSVLGASAWLPFLPMLPVQLLVQNLLYDFSQIGIPFDNVDEEYLKEPRKWNVPAIARFMLFLGPVSSLFDYATFALMWFVFGANTHAGQSLFQTGWFVEGLISQTLIVHIIRTRKIPFLESRAALPLSLLTGVVICAGLAIPFSPFGKTIGLTPLPGVYFVWLVAALTAYGVMAQLMKNWFARRFGYY